VSLRRLDAVVCVVTGAARGIGLAIAERLAGEGGRVAMWDLSQRRLDPAVAGLRERGLDVRGYGCDVSARAAVAQAMRQVETDFGAPVGVLVNNAVWAKFQPLAEIDEEMVDRTFAVGLKAMLWTLQAALPQMQRGGGGSIVNLSSVAAQSPQADAIVYSSMKAGVLGLTRAAAVELSPMRIRVNTVLPGMVGTPASKAQFDAATLAAREAVMPLGRFGDPADIAAAVAFLASDDACYVQGTELIVDGGWTVGTT
jgi:3-oxoacyl-[acyl-carrier protein] reductase